MGPEKSERFQSLLLLSEEATFERLSNLAFRCFNPRFFFQKKRRGYLGSEESPWTFQSPRLLSKEATAAPHGIGGNHRVSIPASSFRRSDGARSMEVEDVRMFQSPLLFLEEATSSACISRLPMQV